MSNEKNIHTENDTLTIVTDGLVLTYGPETDRRIVGAIDGKLQTRSASAAIEIAGELRAWGVLEARSFGNAVVFW